MLIDSSFPGGYPMEHGGEGTEREKEREETVYKTYGLRRVRVCATRGD